ncbi:hypothetical protein QTO34_007150, partial [Cnephaeus nilssonii]
MRAAPEARLLSPHIPLGRSTAMAQTLSSRHRPHFVPAQQRSGRSRVPAPRSSHQPNQLPRPPQGLGLPPAKEASMPCCPGSDCRVWRRIRNPYRGGSSFAAPADRLDTPAAELSGLSAAILRLDIFLPSDFFPDKAMMVGAMRLAAAFLTQTVCLDDTTVKFEIWDTAGQERYHSLAPMYYRGAQAAIVVYDITNEESFARAKNWVKELQRQASPNIVIALSGNKADLANKRAVDFQEAQSYADDNSLLFMETSAKTSMNVNEIFMAIAKKLPKNEPQNPGANSARGRGVDLTEPTQPTRSHPGAISQTSLALPPPALPLRLPAVSPAQGFWLSGAPPVAAPALSFCTLVTQCGQSYMLLFVEEKSRTTGKLAEGNLYSWTEGDGSNQGTNAEKLRYRGAHMRYELVAEPSW